jgi:hypothetical protein
MLEGDFDAAHPRPTFEPTPATIARPAVAEAQPRAIVASLTQPAKIEARPRPTIASLLAAEGEVQPKPTLASLSESEPEPDEDRTNAEPTSRSGFSFGFGWLTRLDEIAQNLPYARQLGRQIASLGPEEAAPDTTAAITALRRAGLVLEAEIDDEHPEELMYQPYSVLALLGDASTPGDESLAGLAHPDIDDIGLRLPEFEVSAPSRFQAQQGGDEFLHERRFTGPAVAIMQTAAADHAVPGGRKIVIR